MKTEKPLIVISNDDGVEAKGINELILYLHSLGEIFVMAPDTARSGMAGAITAGNPVFYREIRREEGLTVCACSGTPSDCIKLAYYLLGPRKPDLVVAGINHGDNSSINVHNSGTMGAVMEGCLKGIPSIGYSLCSHDPDADFGPTAPYIRRITEYVLVNGLPHNVCLNVNFPDRKVFKGVKICKQTDGMWSGEWEEKEIPGKGKGFWLTGRFINYEPDDETTDRWALTNGYVAITPTTIDATAYSTMEKLEDWELTVNL